MNFQNLVSLFDGSCMKILKKNSMKLNGGFSPSFYLKYHSNFQQNLAEKSCRLPGKTSLFPCSPYHCFKNSPILPRTLNFYYKTYYHNLFLKFHMEPRPCRKSYKISNINNCLGRSEFFKPLIFSVISILFSSSFL